MYFCLETDKVLTFYTLLIRIGQVLLWRFEGKKYQFLLLQKRLKVLRSLWVAFHFESESTHLIYFPIHWTIKLNNFNFNQTVIFDQFLQTRCQNRVNLTGFHWLFQNKHASYKVLYKILYTRFCFVFLMATLTFFE